MAGRSLGFESRGSSSCSEYTWVMCILCILPNRAHLCLGGLSVPLHHSTGWSAVDCLPGTVSLGTVFLGAEFSKVFSGHAWLLLVSVTCPYLVPRGHPCG